MLMQLPTPIQPITDPAISQLCQQYGVTLAIKRDDLIDPVVSGNKWRKLKYHLEAFHQSEHSKVLSFGGAFSNHLHALAYLAKQQRIASIGIIRGDELTVESNPTLQDLQRWGMQCEFVTREAYKQRYQPDYLAQLSQQFGDYYLVPEGGYSLAASRGCEEIIDEVDGEFEHVLCPVGSGATLAGLACAASQRLPNTQIHGICALKNGSYLNQQIEDLISERLALTLDNWQLHTDYHFGGFAKQNQLFKQLWQQYCIASLIPWEPVYTAKMLFAVLDMMQQGQFTTGSRILMLHTGGLQGNRSQSDATGS